MCAITTRYGARLPSGFARSTQVSAKARARGATRSNETVPGVGPIVALTAIAVFADGSRSEIAKHAASYSGLVQVSFNQASVTLIAASPSADRLNCARCCARRRIMREG